MARTKHVSFVFKKHSRNNNNNGGSRAVKEPMKASKRLSRDKEKQVQLKNKKNGGGGGQRLKERVIKEGEGEEESKKKRIMRTGSARRGVIRETEDSTYNVIAKSRFKRMIKAMCQELGTNPVVVPPLFDGSRPFKGFKNGLTRGSSTRTGNLVITPNDKLLRIQFGANVLHTLQQVSERDIAKIVEHAFHARVESMNAQQRKEAQGKKIRIRPTQVEGALFRYFEEKDPMALTYFRHFAYLLDKTCSVSASRVV